MRVESEMHETTGMMPRALPREAMTTSEQATMIRGEAFLRAMGQGDRRVLESLVTHDVRLTSFDRGQIHEAQGRDAVCTELLRVAERAAGPFMATGSREAEDALFLWGGDSKSDRPGWMITLFLHHSRFFDVRIYLLR